MNSTRSSARIPLGFALATLVCSPFTNAQGLNYNASKSNTGNIVVSNGTNCTTLIVSTDASGNITGSSATTIPCTVPQGEYTFAPLTTTQIPAVVTQIPQFVDGGGWQTTLVITNTTPSAATASLAFNQETAAGDGTTQPWTPTFIEGNNTQSLTLAPSATLFLHTPGTNPTLSVGWGQLTASDGVQAYALFTWSATSGGQGTAPAATSANDVLLPYDNTAVNGTAVAVANPTAVSETVSVSFETDSGTISQSSFTVPAYGHKAFLLRSQFPSTGGNRGLAEFSTTNAGGISMIGLQFNPADSFTTAEATPLNNRTTTSIIGAADPSVCAANPSATGCPNPPFLVQTLSATFTSGGATYPVVINITPGPNGTYNAAVTGTVAGTVVNGSFVGGVISINKESDQASPPWSLTFNSVGASSTFTGGVLAFSFTETGFDASSGEGVGTVSGQISLTQPGVGAGTFALRSMYVYFPGVNIN